MVYFRGIEKTTTHYYTTYPQNIHKIYTLIVRFFQYTSAYEQL